MSNQNTKEVELLFSEAIILTENLISFKKNHSAIDGNQEQTKDIFSDKWVEADEYESIDKMYEFQLEWFLTLYGFGTEEKLASFLLNKKVILDSGCGLGYKASWFAKLARMQLLLVLIFPMRLILPLRDS